jgi:hypothetical protein
MAAGANRRPFFGMQIVVQGFSPFLSSCSRSIHGAENNGLKEQRAEARDYFMSTTG